MITQFRDAWDRLVSRWRRDHRAAEEARVEGGTALFAIAKDTSEGDIQAATQRAAWAAQIKLIEQKEHRGHADGLLLAQLRRNIRAVDEAEAKRHPTPENMAGRRLADFGPVGAARGFLGPIAANPVVAMLCTPWTLVIATLALVGVQTGRLNHAKADLSQARNDVRAAVQISHDWEQRAEQYRQGLIDAANVAHQAAAALDAERQAQARAAARERRRNREIANVLANSPEPPAWRLRDDEPPQDQPAAPTP